MGLHFRLLTLGSSSYIKDFLLCVLQIRSLRDRGLTEVAVLGPIGRRTRAQTEKALDAEARRLWESKRLKTNGGGSANVKKEKKKGVYCSEKGRMGSYSGRGLAKRSLKEEDEDIVEVKEEEGDDDIVEEEEEFRFCYDNKDYVIKKTGSQYCFDQRKEKGKGCFESLDSGNSSGLKRKYGLQRWEDDIVIDLDSSSDEDAEECRRVEVSRMPEEECLSSSEEEEVSSEESCSFSEDDSEEEEADEDDWLDEDSDESAEKIPKRLRPPGSESLNVASRTRSSKPNLGGSGSRLLRFSAEKSVPPSGRRSQFSAEKIVPPSNLGSTSRRLRFSTKESVPPSGRRVQFSAKKIVPPSNLGSTSRRLDSSAREIVPRIVIEIDGDDNQDKKDVRVKSTSSNAAMEIDHSSHDDSNEVEELCTVADDCSAIHGNNGDNVNVNGNGEVANKEVDGEKEGDVGDPTRTKQDADEGNVHKETGHEEIVEEKEGNVEETTKTKPVEVPKDVSLFKLFVSSIWETGGKLEKEETVPGVEVEKSKYKFRYGVEEPKPVEKSENDLLLDELWAEYDFVLKSLEIGSLVENENLNKQNVVPNDQSSLCSDGQHDFIIDEQVGIKCRCCLFVKTEIRYILPPLDTTCRYGGSGKKRYADSGDASMWEGFHFEDDWRGSQRSYDHAEGTVWDLFPRIREHMYPHQQEGFEFLWRNIAGGIEISELKKPDQSDSIGGCVISHAPGTGKTLLTIVFLQSYMEVFKECRAVIIAPCSMLLTWEEEFKKWKAKTPFHNLNSPEFSGKEDKMARELVQGKANHSSNMKWLRMVKLLSWSKGRSVLGVSYSLFGKLSKGRSTKDVDGQEAEEIGKILLEKPSLLVLDEGHIPRNKRSRIWRALEKIKTERRIILSGTPFQNNFEELYNTLSLVRPKFLDSIPSAKTQKKEARGKWASLTSCIGKDADVNLEEIRAMMLPFVHVHKGSILKDNLPGLRDCVVVLNPPPLQMQLLEEVKKIPEQNGFELEHAISLVSLHPSLLIECNCSKADKSLVDQFTSKGIKLDEITSQEFRLDPYQGVKTRFLMELIPLTVAKNEKILVFSQYINSPFSLIKDQLHHYFNWTEGEEVLQMDGTDNMKHRQSMINLFNDPSSKVRILLASIKACNEGINLVGASRVVLLDVVWNPSVERQAISRAYRLGQTRVVYTYHLITSDTMEGEKFRKQVSKDRLSELVFSSSQAGQGKQSDSLTVHGDAILEEMIGSKKLNDMFKEIIYQPKEADLVDTYI